MAPSVWRSSETIVWFQKIYLHEKLREIKGLTFFEIKTYKMAIITKEDTFNMSRPVWKFYTGWQRYLKWRIVARSKYKISSPACIYMIYLLHSRACSAKLEKVLLKVSPCLSPLLVRKLFWNSDFFGERVLKKNGKVITLNIKYSNLFDLILTKPLSMPLKLPFLCAFSCYRSFWGTWELGKPV